MYEFQQSPAADIVPIAGQRVSTRLVNNTQNHRIALIGEATVQVAGAAATTLLNKGDFWAMIEELGISENGKDTVLLDGPTARFTTEMFSPSALSADRAGTGVATYTLRSLAVLNLAGIFNAVPRETAYRELDPRQALEVFVKLSKTPETTLYVAGGATITVSNVRVRVIQEHNAVESVAPFFVPRIRQIVENVAGANAQHLIYIKSALALRAMVIKGESSGLGETDDIINAIALRSDSRDFIGPNKAQLRDLQRLAETEFGGDVFTLASDDSYLGINFVKHGTLNGVLNPQTQGLNLRLELDDQPSAKAGAGTSRIRITLFELETGLPVTNPTIPFTY